MKHFYFFLFLALFFGVSTDATAQVAGDYRTVNGGGNWSAYSTWEFWDGDSWEAVTAAHGYPGELQNAHRVEILSGDTVTLDVNVGTAPIGTGFLIKFLVIGDNIPSSTSNTFEKLTFSQDRLLNAQNIQLLETGILEWNSGSDLRLTLRSDVSLNISNGDLVGTDGCKANQRLIIGTSEYARCKETGNSGSTFEDVEADQGINPGPCLGDTEAPIPTNTTLSAITAQCEVTTLTPPTATDDCSGSVTGSTTTTLPITTPGTTTIVWTYIDANGNSTSQTQDVIIEDTINPTATGPADATYYCTGDVPPADVNLITNATDNCSTPTVTFEGDASTPGQILRTYRVTDASGNFTDLVQTLTISEVTITSQPVDAEVAIGYDAQFTVTASNSNTFQWQVSTDGGIIFTNISTVDNPSAGTATLLLTDADPTMDGYLYRVEVGNSNSGCPPELSAPATLLVYAETVITNRNKTYRVDKYPDP